MVVTTAYEAGLLLVPHHGSLPRRHAWRALTIKHGTGVAKVCMFFVAIWLDLWTLALGNSVFPIDPPHKVNLFAEGSLQQPSGLPAFSGQSWPPTKHVARVTPGVFP